MDDAETLTDANAEKLIGVLAHRLEWHAVTDSSYDGKGDDCTYHVWSQWDEEGRSVVCLHAALALPDFEKARKEYDTLEEVKAACERHNATGKWE